MFENNIASDNGKWGKQITEKMSIISVIPNNFLLCFPFLEGEGVFISVKRCFFPFMYEKK